MEKIGLGEYKDASLILLQLVFMPIGVVALRKGIRATNILDTEGESKKGTLRNNYKANSKLIKTGSCPLKSK
jgi:hypothetical protein